MHLGLFQAKYPAKNIPETNLLAFPAFPAFRQWMNSVHNLKRWTSKTLISHCWTLWNGGQWSPWSKAVAPWICRVPRWHRRPPHRMTATGTGVSHGSQKPAAAAHEEPRPAPNFDSQVTQVIKHWSNWSTLKKPMEAPFWRTRWQNPGRILADRRVLLARLKQVV